MSALYRTALTTIGVAVMATAPAFAQVKIDKFCLKDGKLLAQPIYGNYWDSLLDTKGIAPTTKGYFAASGSIANGIIEKTVKIELACSEKGDPQECNNLTTERSNLLEEFQTNCAFEKPDDKKTFLDIQQLCGFYKAVDAAILQRDAKMLLEETTGQFCSEEGEPYCTNLKAMRTELWQKVREANRSSGANNYTLVLPVNSKRYPKENTRAKVTSFMEDIKIWTNTGTFVQGDFAKLQCPTSLAREPFDITIPRKLGKKLAFAKDAQSIAVGQTGGRPTFTTRAPAELTLAFDRENRTVVEKDAEGNTIRSEYNDFVSFKGALGYDLTSLILKDRGSDVLNFWNNSAITAYIELDYAEKFDPTKETDNLAIGFYLTPELNFPETELIGNPGINFRWITDIEERESAQWKVDINTRIFPLSSLFHDLNTDERFFLFGDLIRKLPLKWTTDAVLDYNHVIDPGDKALLAAVGESFRWGYDVNWEFSQKWLTVGGFNPKVTGSYKFRDVLGRGLGNADLVTIGLDFISPDANKTGVGLGIEYERGENLDSLEAIEAYKLKLTFKGGLGK